MIIQDYPATTAERAFYRIRNNTQAAYPYARNDRLAVAIDIQDIVLTPLIPDVVVYKDEADYAPGYPSLQDPVDFHIAVSNRWAGAPAANFTPVLVWRQEGGDWHETIMTNRAGRTNTGDGVYACVLDPDADPTDRDHKIDAGGFEYFYKVGFTGYTPKFLAIKDFDGELLNTVVNGRYRWGDSRYPHLIHTNDWALLTVPGQAVDKDGQTVTQGFINENRSPAYMLDFPGVNPALQYARNPDVVTNSAAGAGSWDYTSHFDLDALDEDGIAFADANFMYLANKQLATPRAGEVRFALPYPYLTFMAADGVRRFRSMYTDMAVVPRAYDESAKGFRIDSDPVPGLKDAYAMQLVGDYTWQAIIRQEYEIDGIFAVTGTLHSAPGSTVFENGSTNNLPNSPFFWLEVNQDETAINPPSSGYVTNFLSSAEEHIRTETYYVDVPATNVTESATVDLLEVARPEGAGDVVDIPVAWASAADGEEDWSPVDTAWLHATATKKDVVVECVSADNGANVAFYTQYATLTIRYDLNDNEIIETNAWSAGAWEPNIFGTTTNWWPEEIPAGWMKWNWQELSDPGAAFPVYELSGLSTNGWDLQNLIWTTNRMELLEVELSSSATEPWAGVRLSDSALEVVPVATNASAKYVADVSLGSKKEERTKDVPYYTYEPVPDPYSITNLGTRVQIDYDGFLMYRFCTTNGTFQIRRAAWQDFNAWQAVEDKYSRSFGIDDMQTFESDLTGRDLTTFGTPVDAAILDESYVAATSGWSPAGQSLYEAGFSGSSLRIVKERTPAATGSKNRNTAIWLNTHPDAPGSLETTQSTSGSGGRGTLSMRVRSATDDDRIATYNKDASHNWSDYRVVARIMHPSTDQVSDGEHSISLVGYWQDAGNYWEARIIQKSFIEAKGLRNWFEVHIYEWKNGVCTEHFGRIQQSNSNNHGFGGDSYSAKATGPIATWPGRSNADNKYTTYNKNGYYGNNGSDSGRGLFTSTEWGGWVFVFDLKTDTASSTVTPTLWAFRGTDVSSGSAQQEKNYYKYAVSAVPSTVTKGRPGYNMRDCGLNIGAYVFDNHGSTPEAINFSAGSAVAPAGSSANGYKAVSMSSAADWDRSDDWSYDRDQRIDVWKGGFANENTVAGSIGTYPLTLWRPAPKVYYRVRVYRTKEEETASFNAPIGQHVGNGVYADWDTEWDDYHANDPQNRKDGVQYVKSYRWQSVPIELAFWDETFLSVQALPDDGTMAMPDDAHMSHGVLAIENFACTDWRGVTVYDEDYTGTASEGRNLTDSFIATYSAIVPEKKSSKGRRYELNLSRANPDGMQGISTPRLVRGVGDILFAYEVENYPVEVVVQLVNASGSASSDLISTNLAKGASGTLYVPCLSNQTGRLRIVTRKPEGSAEGALGTLYVDDIRATDYPATSETSWEAYNVRVSSFPENPSVKFDGASKAAAALRSSILNDGKTHDTLQEHEFGEHVPFIQTPSIETGVGEVSFWYRAAPDNDGHPAKISLMVADTSRRPDGEWRELVATDLSWDKNRYGEEGWEDDPKWQAQAAQLESLKNITTDRWTYFSVEFYQKDFHVMRIVTGDADTTVQTIPPQNRVMFDNVLITEPVRASIDVGSVEFIPGVPLSTRPTDVKITLVNPRMNPENVQVFLDWYVAGTDLTPYTIPHQTVEYYEKVHPETTNIVVNGQTYVATWEWIETIAHTNESYEVTRLPASMKNPETRKWGYNAWEGSKQTIFFTNAPGERYTFYSVDPIPTDTFQPDTMFQYCVRVKYDGFFAKDIYSETQGKTRNGFWFENPSWYEPINLNTAFETPDQPVAHAFVFSCTTNVVRFNEFRPWLGSDNHQDMQFVELLGPEGAKIGGWTIEHFGVRGDVVDPDFIYYTNILQASAAFVPPNNATTNKGWGTYVLGGSKIESQERLYPIQFENYVGNDPWPTYEWPYMGIIGAMRLRRSMGAYVDRIVWGPHEWTGDFEQMGYTWASYISSYYAYDEENYKSVFNREGEIGGAMVWRTAGSDTVGGYNRDQERYLPSLEAQEAPPVVPPMLDEPEITGISFDGAGHMDISFRVRVLNEIALDDSSGWSWDVEVSAAIGEEEDWNSMVNDPSYSVYMPAVSAPADGTWSDVFTVRVPMLTGTGARFYRIKGTCP